jgi:hypothetical protein
MQLNAYNPAWDFVGRMVMARRGIEDSPLAEIDSSCRRGAVGECLDFSESDNLLYVDFGNGAIACYPEEVTWPK